MAIETLDRAVSRFGTPLYVYHEIVHNRYVVDAFRDKGVVFVDEIEQVPAGSYCVYSAHGVSPEVQRAAVRRRLRVIDATCPLVRKVHSQATHFAELGLTIVLFGHGGHDEVIGTLGHAPDHLVLVETLEDIDRLEVADPAKVAYLTQTTLSVDEARVFIDRLKQRYPQAVGPVKDDVCYATQNRQRALKATIEQVDQVLVVGSPSSSNCNRLAEIARNFGKPAYLVDDAADVDLSWFENSSTVLVTAGASVPEHSVQACVALLVAQFGATVEEYRVVEEHVEFPLPVEVR